MLESYHHLAQVTFALSIIAFDVIIFMEGWALRVVFGEIFYFILLSGTLFPLIVSTLIPLDLRLLDDWETLFVTTSSPSQSSF